MHFKPLDLILFLKIDILTNMSKEFKLVPINPFTPRQAEVIDLMTQGVRTNKDIAHQMGISAGTVKIFYKGHQRLSPQDLGITQTKSDLGIFGIVERAKGIRPTKGNLITRLLGDVILEIPG